MQGGGVAMSILPTGMTENKSVVTVKETTAAPKKTFIFDFENKEFAVDTMNNVITTTDNETIIRGVVEKLLNDTRYRHAIYDRTWGNEIPDLLAQDEPYEVFETEIKRLLREALIWHPYIRDVTNIEITQSGDSIYASFIVESANGIILEYTEKEVA